MNYVTLVQVIPAGKLGQEFPELKAHLRISTYICFYLIIIQFLSCVCFMI